MAASATVRFFFSFRSPYSYLVMGKAFSLPKTHDVAMEWRGVLPMVMRGVPLSRSKMLYILADTSRIARREGIPFGTIADPVGDGAIRCLRVAEFAKDTGRLEPFVKSAARGIWADGIEVAEDAGLRRVSERGGLQWSDVKQAAADVAYDARIQANIALLNQCGQWGVPTFENAGELFWGQDRFDYLVRHLDAQGLRKK